MNARTAVLAALAAITALLLSPKAFAQGYYNDAAGVNAPMMKAEKTVVDGRTGERKRVIVEQAPAKDSYGNAQGSQFDLGVDGAFDGQTVAVIQLYTLESNFDFKLPKAALAQKGFSVYRWIGKAPSPKELENALEKSCQLWVIATDSPQLTEEHVAIIKRFFDAGHGVYIWGDNEPYYADANVLGRALLGVQMSGNLMGHQVVGLQQKPGGPGLLPKHLVMTGIEQIYEGITIATIAPNQQLTPLIYGSAGNFVTGLYERDGKRAIFDGGFTRLYNNWDTAGTARYVKNAAVWLAHAEKFGARASR
ncbi:MAG: hypothetical protein QM765_34340 [Myxococcales bacterium]